MKAVGVIWGLLSYVGVHQHYKGLYKVMEVGVKNLNLKPNLNPSRSVPRHVAQQTTLLETNVETQKGPYRDYSPSKRDYMGSHVNLGECNP